MFTFRCLFSWALLLPLALVTGCSPYLGAPPKQEIRGGFVVLVDVPGQPSAARVVADIDAFAQRRGFVRQGARPAPSVDPATHQPIAPASARYSFGKIVLDVIYEAAHLRVNAYLHSYGSGRDHQLMDQFYRDFHQEYAARYGDEGTIIESDYANDTGGPPRNGGGHGGGGRGKASDHEGGNTF